MKPVRKILASDTGLGVGVERGPESGSKCKLRCRGRLCYRTFPHQKTSIKLIVPTPTLTQK